jgi:SagB-type dehydrogenase family enzyme
METATQALHRLTSINTEYYEAVRLERGGTPAPIEDARVLEFRTNDMSRLPWFFKRYPDSLPRLPLPRDLARTHAPTLAVLAGTADVARGELDLHQLSRLLHLSAGVVRTAENRYGTFPFRAAGSAGGRFPLEVYAATPEGVHWYDAQQHALVEVDSAPREGAPTLVVTGVPWRTGWRYRERGYRHIYWDAGTMLSQLLAAAASAGLGPRLFTRFPDAAVTALVGADGVHEWPVAVVALGAGPPTLEPTGRAATGEVDARPVEFPLMTTAQRAGDRDTLGEAWDRGAPVQVPPQRSAPVEDVVLARSSQRRMDASRGLSQEILHTCMAAALRGIDVPHWVAVHDVVGVPPGLYRWPELEHPVRAGVLRDELYWLAMEQRLARDAAFVVIAAANVAALDDREYREAHLAAGLVEGRLHLLAYALGASASGMTFVDSDVPPFLRENVNPLLFTCVGVPAYTPRPGGPPGAPVRIREVRAG